MNSHPRKMVVLAAALLCASTLQTPHTHAQNAAPPAASPQATTPAPPTATPVPADQLASPCPVGTPSASHTLTAARERAATGRVELGSHGLTSWIGWGNSLANWRFQHLPGAGFSSADVPQLKLKWAFGIPDVKIVRSQPAADNGRVFVGANDGAIYA